MAVLRAYGRDFDVDAYLGACPLHTCAVWHAGEKRSKRRPPAEHSGANFDVSDAEDLAGQITDAVAFLKAKGGELNQLKNLAGVEHRVLDFAVTRRDLMVQCYYFPPELVHLAAELRIGLELTVFAAWEEISGEASEEQS